MTQLRPRDSSDLGLKKAEKVPWKGYMIRKTLIIDAYFFWPSRTSREEDLGFWVCDEIETELKN